MKRLRIAFLRYFTENFDDLLELDLKWARLLGAPSPHTLSGYAYLLESQGKWYGQILRQIIDFIFKWLLYQENHCFDQFQKETSLPHS